MHGGIALNFIDDVLYFGSLDKHFYALNASSESMLWNFTAGREIDSGVVWDGASVRETRCRDAVGLVAPY